MSRKQSSNLVPLNHTVCKRALVTLCKPCGNMLETWYFCLNHAGCCCHNLFQQRLLWMLKSDALNVMIYSLSLFPLYFVTFNFCQHIHIPVFVLFPLKWALKYVHGNALIELEKDSGHLLNVQFIPITLSHKHTLSGVSSCLWSGEKDQVYVDVHSMCGCESQ